MPAKEPRLDEFIAKAVTDPKNPGEVLLVTGFLGASSEPEHTRIYWDASLGTYVDVKTTDISHTEPLPKEQSPLGGSYIWLKRDAQVHFGAGGQSAKGKFFEGPLMAAYGGQFGALGGGVAGVPAAQALAVAGIGGSYAPGCWHSWNACPSDYGPLCGPHQSGGFCTPGCPRFQAQELAGAAAAPIAGSYAQGCWFSWNACPSMVGPACGPHHQSYFFCTPKFQAQELAGAAAAPIAGSYAPGCWHSWNACPSDYGPGCGPHQSRVFCTPGCPQLQAQIAGTHGVQCWVSYGACNTYHYPCGSVGGGCGSVGVVCPIR
jgi:hypothetical protein